MFRRQCITTLVIVTQHPTSTIVGNGLVNLTSLASRPTPKLQHQTPMIQPCNSIVRDFATPTSTDKMSHDFLATDSSIHDPSTSSVTADASSANPSSNDSQQNVRVLRRLKGKKQASESKEAMDVDQQEISEEKRKELEVRSRLPPEELIHEGEFGIQTVLNYLKTQKLMKCVVFDVRECSISNDYTIVLSMPSSRSMRVSFRRYHTCFRIPYQKLVQSDSTCSS